MNRRLEEQIRSAVGSGRLLREERVRYFTEAAGLLLGKGVAKEQVISIIMNAQGDYPLGKKYGVTPEQFAVNVKSLDDL